MMAFETLRETLVAQVNRGELKTALQTLTAIVGPEHPFWQDLAIPSMEEIEVELPEETIGLLIERLTDLKEDDLTGQWQQADAEEAPDTPSAIPEDLVSADTDALLHEQGVNNLTSLVMDEVPQSEQTEDLDLTDTISFDRLKNKLIREILEKDDFQVPYEVIETIVAHNDDLRSDFLLIKVSREMLRREFNRGSMSWETYKLDLVRVFASVSDCLEPLCENDLLDSWRTTEAVKSFMNVGLGINGGGEPPPPEVQVHLTKIDLPTGDNRTGIPDEKIHKYKQLMIKAQDEIGSGNYPLAYELSEKASGIVSVMPQVYEFMLLSFLKHETPENIVDKALGGDEQLFRRLNVYAQKLKVLSGFAGTEKKEPEKTKRKRVLPGFANSLHEAAYALLAELKRRYFLIRFDYIFSDTENQLERKKVKAIMEFAKKVYEIYPSLSFINTLQIELCGAGKFDWLKTDSKFKLINKTSFDAIKYWQDLEKIFQEAVSVQNKTVQVREVSDLFYFSLIKKYASIKLDYRDSEAVRIGKRRRMIRIIEAWKVAYKLAPDKRFLEKAISELSGEQEFTWVRVDQEGKLDQHLTCRQLRYSPLEELPLLLQQAGQNPETYLTELKEIIRKDNLEWAERFYEKMVNKKQTLAESEWPGEPDDRKRILRCLFNWRVSFILTQDPVFLDKIRKELSGAGIFSWFDFSTKGDLKVKLALPYYNPLEEVKWLLQQSTEADEANNFIAYAIFNELQTAYDRIPDHHPDNSITHLAALKLIVQKARFCFRLYPDPGFLDLAYEELNTGKKFLWLERVYLINRHIGLTHPACIKIGFNPISELEIIRETLAQNE